MADDIIPLRRTYALSMVERITELEAEIERLRSAGDALAHTLSVQSEWTCCADGWFGPCDCPPDAASRPTNGRVATALDTWKEVRRG